MEPYVKLNRSEAGKLPKKAAGWICSVDGTHHVAMATVVKVRLVCRELPCHGEFWGVITPEKLWNTATL
jgi:hypothetical protein